MNPNTGQAELRGVQRTSTEVRDLLADRIRRDLLGPFHGDDEQLTRPGPRERYIVGVLAPADADVDEDPGDDEDLDAGEFGDESADRPAPGVSAVRLHPSSAGLTFTIPATVDAVEITASWGRYARPKGAKDDTVEPTPTAEAARLVVNTDPKERPWVRTPIAGSVIADVTIAAGAGGHPVRDEAAPAPVEAPQVAVDWVVREHDGRRIVTVFLVNRQTHDSFPDLSVDAAWLFQAALSVTAVDGSAIFLPVDGGAGFIGRKDEQEQAQLALLYRNHAEYAAGHGTSAAWAEPDDVDPADRRAMRVWTDALPWHDVPQTQAPTAADIPGFADLELDMAALATAPDGAAAAAMLRPLTAAYRAWLDTQAARITTDPDVAAYAAVAADNIAAARMAADRIDAGIDLVAEDEPAWQAFRFANQAMALQRQHSDAMNTRRVDPQVSLADALAAADVPARRSWRPFQIAFVLLNLPALTDPVDSERTAGGPGQPAAEQALADLLFFPTGGGKTEAYLGLTAYTFAIRRLIPDLGGLDASRGVAVLMRYTLRLLTSQQLQRATTLVAAADTIRREDPDLWGHEPFRVGLWVGGGVTPNRFDDSLGFVRTARGVGGKQDAAAASPVPFTECPWCGTPIDVKKNVEADETLRRTRIFCGDDTGACDFTARRNPEGLPVMAVDEEIYRYPPSLLIATVDKFAQLPRRAAAGHLFGRVSRECSRHGLRTVDGTDGGCSADSHRADGDLPAAATTPADRLRPPDLIIQDELHLIADALGTMVGLYETAVDELSTWDVDGHRVRPKVVASTATVRRAAEQGYALFRRRLAVFPPPVIDVEDSFFARQIPVDAAHPGRRYMGVCAQGLRLKTVEIRTTSAIMAFAQELFDDDGAAADPYMTLVAYFNALRELGGMRRLVEDDVASRLSRPLHPHLPRRRTPIVAELTSRVPSGSIKDALKELEVTFDPDTDTTAARQAWIDAQAAAGQTGRKGKTKTTSESARAMAKDVLLATNMFAVGVDISRLGLMTVTGQPKATSEYIQATSRVGRDPARPGLVVTIYNWVRPRDLSHYERFTHYHDTFYRQVEALSVTPFSVPALHRGITGAFFGALRHLDLKYSPDVGMDVIHAEDPQVQVLVDMFAQRAEAVVGRPDAGNEARALLAKRLDAMRARRAHAGGQTQLAYRGGKQGLQGMLRDPNASGGWDDWTVPNSLRETEPEINLQLRPFDPSISDTSIPPPWQPRSNDAQSGGGDA